MAASMPLMSSPLNNYSKMTADLLYEPFKAVQATGEHTYADEMLERALYAFEMAWHPTFSPATGNCSLDFAHQPNRAFFKCLFRQTQASQQLCMCQVALTYRGVCSSGTMPGKL